MFPAGAGFFSSTAASLLISPRAALRLASKPGSSATGSIIKFIKLTKAITIPGVRPRSVSARYAPMRNTPVWATTPATEPIIPTRIFMRRLLNFSPSSARLFSANRRNISLSALKVFTTANPPRQSLKAAVKSRFRSETRRSAAVI